MAAFSVPSRAVAQTFSGASEFKFATGLYVGTLENFETKDLPSRADGTPFAGYATTDGARVSVRLGDIEPLDGDASPKDEIGNRKHFVDLVLSDGSEDVTTVDVSAKDAPNWQLQKSAMLVVTLAQALGETQDDGAGNTTVSDGFIDALYGNAYAGTRVAFKLVRNAKGYVNTQYFSPSA